MILRAARLGDDVHRAAGRGAVFGRKAVVQDGHFLHGSQRQVAEKSLPAPTVVAVGAVDFKPRLAAARAVGGEHVLIHEHVALVDGLSIGGVQEGQVGDPPIEQRSVLHLLSAQTIAELRTVGAHFPYRPCNGDLRVPPCCVELQIDVGGGASGQRQAGGLHFGETLFGGDDIVAADGQTGDGVAAGVVGLRGAFKAGELVGHGHLHRRHIGMGLVDHMAAKGGCIGGLGSEKQRGKTDQERNAKH